MSWDWEECVAEGNTLFEYMIHNFDSMFDDRSIKHFDIRYTTIGMIIYSHVIRNKYRKQIQPNLITWIKEELDSKRLLEYSNWKPRRDAYEYSFMHMGYNKLFTYKHYYFQLGIQSDCVDCVDCVDCIDCNKADNQIHFELLLYGWDKKDPHVDKLQPEHKVILPHNRMIPDSFWIWAKNISEE